MLKFVVGACLGRTTKSVKIVATVNSSGENMCMSVLSW
jgi:hypothetical protein